MSSDIRHRILLEWERCRVEWNSASPSGPISTFGFKAVSEIDLDGHWFKERDRRSQTNSSRPRQIAQPTRVLFPGQHVPIDPSSRPAFFFRRSLLRRTASQYSFAHLDEAFSQIAPSSFVAPVSEADNELIVDRASHLLSRLPATPLRLPNLLAPPEDPDKHGWLRIDGGAVKWETLESVHRVSTCVIRMALAIATTWDRSLEQNMRGRESHKFRELLDFLSELLDSTSYELEMLGPQMKWQSWRWFVLKSYLWSTWQRCVALHYWRILQDQLVSGFDYTSLSDLTLRPNVDSVAASEQQTALKSEYMCSLAYHILRRSRSTAVLDLRKFHSVFSRQFRYEPGRCNNVASCDGTSPSACRRIKGATIVDQSQHDLLCPDPKECRRIRWDESSYRQVVGARAVSIMPRYEEGDDEVQHDLKFETASGDTLAVSHVWSHGQGGRPETGINECLHRRYCGIARKFGCSSYWIDVTCIPSAHELREEAIMNINKVFLSSRTVLLCDKDLMGIDTSVIETADDSAPASVSLMESILCTLLVCDWNVRAWTLLEALRGRKNIHILVQSGGKNRAISLRKILQSVTMHGSINIGILFLMNYHLFPAPSSFDWLTLNTDGSSELRMAKVKDLQRRGVFNVSYDARLAASRIEGGFLSVSEAATLLAQRFASRPGDDVIIWSLLVGDDPFSNAYHLWTRSTRGLDLMESDRAIYTGYLLSNVPRLHLPGFSWAPRQPGLLITAHGAQDSGNQYPPYDGNLSRIGTIEFNYDQPSTPKAYLRAVWGVSSLSFERGVVKSYDFRPPRTDMVPHAALLNSLENFSEGILLQPLQEIDESSTSQADIEGGAGADPAIALASVYKGPSRGPLFAICGRKAGGSVNDPWIWAGVLDWGAGIELPHFEVREVVLQ
ncbi:hypothetical protein B0T16DRAFT_417354 [Cercophora newfieldiana]|uniref:Heterokaryon incompatibility domain-containing protein n=1 Tax=Cercophora newfieldiana TaxID=92897 RepID=A0AA40CMA9_9PEZI|nr:hypothetical protein B0T16DRAFT_417354 [Cercophora newfieldiana]